MSTEMKRIIANCHGFFEYVIYRTILGTAISYSVSFLVGGKAAVSTFKIVGVGLSNSSSR